MLYQRHYSSWVNGSSTQQNSFRHSHSRFPSPEGQSFCGFQGKGYPEKRVRSRQSKAVTYQGNWDKDSGKWRGSFCMLPGCQVSGAHLGGTDFSAGGDLECRKQTALPLLFPAAAPSSGGIQASPTAHRASLLPLDWASSRYVNSRIPSDHGWGFAEPFWDVSTAASGSHLPAFDLSYVLCPYALREQRVPLGALPASLGNA